MEGQRKPGVIIRVANRWFHHYADQKVTVLNGRTYVKLFIIKICLFGWLKEAEKSIFFLFLQLQIKYSIADVHETETLFSSYSHKRCLDESNNTEQRRVRKIMACSNLIASVIKWMVIKWQHKHVLTKDHDGLCQHLIKCCENPLFFVYSIFAFMYKYRQLFPLLYSW